MSSARDLPLVPSHRIVSLMLIFGRTADENEIKSVRIIFKTFGGIRFEIHVRKKEKIV